MTDIKHNLDSIYSEIDAINSPNGKPKIIAVSKKQPLEKIRKLYELGINEFAENFAQEAIDKITELELDTVWHFIGNIQSNKTKVIANHFDWVHSITRYKIAKRLNNHRIGLEPINACIQVKIDADDERESISRHEVRELMDQIKDLENIKLRGLMGISTPDSSIDERRNGFSKLYQFYKDLNDEDYGLDTLSMGMSDDYKIAIQNGSNMIRIGTVLFGKRRIRNA